MRVNQQQQHLICVMKMMMMRSAAAAAAADTQEDAEHAVLCSGTAMDPCPVLLHHDHEW